MTRDGEGHVSGVLAIRSYEHHDEQGVTSLWHAAFPNDPRRNEPSSVIRRKLSVQPELLLVGELDGRIVAALVGGFDGYRGWVYHLAVSAEHRRKGFGRAMMAELEVRLARLGCPKLNLQVRESNREVVAFYQRLGYEIEERVSMGKRLA